MKQMKQNEQLLQDSRFPNLVQGTCHQTVKETWDLTQCSVPAGQYAEHLNFHFVESASSTLRAQ